MKDQTPKFALLQYEVLKQLKLTPAEYWYLDMVWHLSRQGWCRKSLENCAADMNMTKMGVVKLRNRLIEKKLIKKSLKGYVSTTEMYNKVYLTNSKPYNKVYQPVNKVIRGGKQSLPKNNNRSTLEYKKGRQLAEAIKERYPLKRKPVGNL